MAADLINRVKNCWQVRNSIPRTPFDTSFILTVLSFARTCSPSVADVMVRLHVLWNNNISFNLIQLRNVKCSEIGMQMIMNGLNCCCFSRFQDLFNIIVMIAYTSCRPLLRPWQYAYRHSANLKNLDLFYDHI